MKSSQCNQILGYHTPGGVRLRTELAPPWDAAEHRGLTACLAEAAWIVYKLVFADAVTHTNLMGVLFELAQGHKADAEKHAAARGPGPEIRAAIEQLDPMPPIVVQELYDVFVKPTQMVHISALLNVWVKVRPVASGDRDTIILLTGELAAPHVGLPLTKQHLVLWEHIRQADIELRVQAHQALLSPPPLPALTRVASELDFDAPPAAASATPPPSPDPPTEALNTADAADKY